MVVIVAAMGGLLEGAGRARYFLERNEDGEMRVNCVGEKTGTDTVVCSVRFVCLADWGKVLPLPALAEIGYTVRVIREE